MAATILITAAGGLIGRHVQAAWDIDDLSPVLGLPHDLADLLVPGAARAVVERLRPSVVLHLAWTASGTPAYRTSPDNERWVATTVELAGAARATGALFVGTGTSVEADPVCRVDAYTAAKAEVRQLLEKPISRGEIGWLQPFYVFDPVVGRPALVADSLEARAAGTDVRLRSPEHLHDFIHAADVGRAIVACVRSGLTGQIPIGSGKARRVCDLVSALGTSWVPDPHTGEGTTHTQRFADTRRLRSTGWVPTSTEEFFAPCLT